MRGFLAGHSAESRGGYGSREVHAIQFYGRLAVQEMAGKSAVGILGFCHNGVTGSMRVEGLDCVTT